jgi:hypothetical protein
MKNAVIYDVIDRTTKVSLIPNTTSDREEARARKLLLKQQGLDAVIEMNRVGVISSKIIR